MVVVVVVYMHDGVEQAAQTAQRSSRRRTQQQGDQESKVRHYPSKQTHLEIWAVPPSDRSVAVVGSTIVVVDGVVDGLVDGLVVDVVVVDAASVSQGPTRWTELRRRARRRRESSMSMRARAGTVDRHTFQSSVQGVDPIRVVIREAKPGGVLG